MSPQALIATAAQLMEERNAHLALLSRFLEAAQLVAEELGERYDGAEDSRTQWMGEPLCQLQAVIAAARAANVLCRACEGKHAACTDCGKGL